MHATNFETWKREQPTEGEWRRYHARTQTNFIVTTALFVVAFFFMGLFAAVANADDVTKSVNAGCISLLIESDTDNVYLTSHYPLDVTLEEKSSVAVVKLYTCVQVDATECDDYFWDHDGDGSKTQSTLNGDGTTFQRGTSVPNVPVVRLEVTTQPASGTDARISACPSSL